jgi:hypothetical protein
MMKRVASRNGVPIRLTDERWSHITESHCEMAGYYYEILECVEDPDAVYEGRYEELIGMKEMQKDKYIVVMYKEVSEKDGFVITSFITSKKEQFERRKKRWEK